MDAELKVLVKQLNELLLRVEPLLPSLSVPIDWSTTLAARWEAAPQQGILRAVNVSQDRVLGDLVGMDRQRALLEANTRQFVQGLPANHALLWGARGTGKSSMVRALLVHFAAAGLRLIEVERNALQDLPQIINRLEGVSEYRFIIFCDDLSFEAGEGEQRMLKTVLDGSLAQAPENMLLYATSNRRHLVAEPETDNNLRVGELHANEAVEDRIALSDRFGLWLSFHAFTQTHYLDVVRHWIEVESSCHHLQWHWSDELELSAIRWATARGNRNGRTAYQFARYWVGQCLLEETKN